MKAPPPNPRFRRGDDVTVHERAIAPWTGVVQSVKWSSLSGWYADVLRDDGMVYVVHESKLRAVVAA